MRLPSLLLLLASTVMLAACPQSPDQRSSSPPMGDPAASAFGKPESGGLRTASGNLNVPGEEPIEVLVIPPGAVEPGVRAQVRVEFRPREHVKVPIYPSAYAEGFEVVGGVEAPQGRVPARVLTPEEEDKGRLAYYEGAPPSLGFELQVPASAKAGSYPFAAQVHYFYCHDTGGICAKRDVRVEGVLDVGAAHGRGG